MAIAKKPKPAPASDAAAEAFISGKDTPAPAPEPEPTGRKQVMIRFDPVLLERVDKAAKRSGISRSSWVQYQLNKALEDMGL
ncbi:hypothetical protein TSH7_09985 [Azospirillum sp. TSH7]|uniref:hypothetical protein n=1 Tax=unclassified Azospirillum TaxID=2630922 RepID=UPI000D61077E|nr:MULTISPECIES: hypothetical protein [unclassified Azospirillum]PWC63998.1 hypothetical protein TSH20_19080 [Azospirillum sp. TSH20]PWC64861.1 hypothetical protein TSH7_09985 [Azospirillum sp. TSH7]